MNYTIITDILLFNAFVLVIPKQSSHKKYTIQYYSVVFHFRLEFNFFLLLNCQYG